MSDYQEFEPSMLSHVKVYAIATKHGLGDLKTLALQKYKKWVDIVWDDDSSWDYMTDFVEVINLIYNKEFFPQHDETMHTAVWEHIVHHVDNMQDVRWFWKFLQD